MTTEKAIEIVERIKSDDDDVYSKESQEALSILLEIAKRESNIPKLIDSGLLVDVEYLMETHPELSIQEAQELFTFLLMD